MIKDAVGKNGNVIPNSALSPDERRERARKAAQANVEKIRARKTFQEDVIAALSAVMQDGKTVQEAAINSVVSKMLKGDLEAFKTIRDTAGEKPIDRQVVRKAEDPFDGLTSDELRALISGKDTKHVCRTKKTK